MGWWGANRSDGWRRRVVGVREVREKMWCFSGSERGRREVRLEVLEKNATVSSPDPKPRCVPLSNHLGGSASQPESAAVNTHELLFTKKISGVSE